MQNSVKVINLKKSYGTKEAVKNISFEIKENEIIGLLGPNGSGKTTTIGMILGLLKPTSGEVLINGLKIEENPIEILQKINFISPYIELPKKLTVRQNLEVYGRLYGIKDLNGRIDEISEDLDIKNFFNRKTGELSSGQKNRVSLAKALINDTEILLLDEPTSRLEPEVGDYIRTYIENFASKKGTTILLASHNMNEVERLCNEVMMMKNGQIIDKGTCKSLINKHGRENLEETFLKLVRE